ncbi:hypothetical protein [Sphingomonas flavescens]|uniref:hypothetical protein n=1 Tax=Sphingomonas flavescens TaxID=3132797 RepID=UPI002804C5F2|nr:hypothetical protein [Sphingomonas limnosediminicola]
MRAQILWFPLTAALLVAACDRPAIDASQSLVGAKQLPGAKTLRQEIIQLNRSYGGASSSLLSYELGPDNGLTVTVTHRDPDTWKDITDAKETSNLSTQTASQARNELWRLRPEALQGVEERVSPADCPTPPTDTFPIAAVVFIAKGTKPGINDRVAVVDVPAQYTCDTLQGRAARNLIEKVLQQFPHSKVAAEFDRRRPTVVIP